VKNLTSARINDIHLPELADGFAGDLGAHEKVDGLRFDGTVLDGLDLAGVSLNECKLTGVSAHETDLRASTFVDVAVDRLNAPILSAPRSTWRNLVVMGSRIGSAELYESTLRSVHFFGCKFGYLNLRGSSLLDVRFTNCVIDELDLGGATTERLDFQSTETRVLDVTRARLTNIDVRDLQFRQVNGLEGLKGATMSERQVAELAGVFAAHLGIVVEG
jgi:uncharacterized protein YjbI with pentapeptide repeats